MVHERRYAIKYDRKYLRIILMTTAVMCLLTASSSLSKSLSSLAAVIRQSAALYPVNPAVSFYSSDNQQYTHIGDWEPPDVLLLVDNEEWRESLEVIVKASDHDGIPVYLLTDHYEAGEAYPERKIKKQGGGQPLMFSYDTPWIRDYGPVQMKSAGKRVHWLDFNYAEDRPRDDSVPQQLAEYMNLPIESGNYYLEGGGIISNGRGLCAITDTSLEKSLVDPSDPGEIASFRRTLGCSALAILPALTGESTGHADIIAQFFSPEIIAISTVHPDISYEVSLELDAAAESLVSAARSISQRLRVVRLPMYVDGPDFYSYVNGTRLKHLYLVPSFQNVPDDMEKEAYEIIRSVLQGTKPVPVPADKMVQSGGAVHCITLGLSLPRSAESHHTVQEDRVHMLYQLFSYVRKTFQQEFQ